MHVDTQGEIWKVDGTNTPWQNCFIPCLVVYRVVQHFQSLLSCLYQLAATWPIVCACALRNNGIMVKSVRGQNCMRADDEKLIINE